MRRNYKNHKSNYFAKPKDLKSRLKEPLSTPHNEQKQEMLHPEVIIMKFTTLEVKRRPQNVQRIKRSLIKDNIVFIRQH